MDEPLCRRPLGRCARRSAPRRERPGGSKTSQTGPVRQRLRSSPATSFAKRSYGHTPGATYASLGRPSIPIATAGSTPSIATAFAGSPPSCTVPRERPSGSSPRSAPGGYATPVNAVPETATGSVRQAQNASPSKPLQRPPSTKTEPGRPLTATATFGSTPSRRRSSTSACSRPHFASSTGDSTGSSATPVPSAAPRGSDTRVGHRLRRVHQVAVPEKARRRAVGCRRCAGCHERRRGNGEERQERRAGRTTRDDTDFLRSVDGSPARASRPAPACPPAARLVATAAASAGAVALVLGAPLEQPPRPSGLVSTRTHGPAAAPRRISGSEGGAPEPSGDGSRRHRQRKETNVPSKARGSSGGSSQSEVQPVRLGEIAELAVPEPDHARRARSAPRACAGPSTCSMLKNGFWPTSCGETSSQEASQRTATVTGRASWRPRAPRPGPRSCRRPRARRCRARWRSRMPSAPAVRSPGRTKSSGTSVTSIMSALARDSWGGPRAAPAAVRQSRSRRLRLLVDELADRLVALLRARRRR